MNRPDLPILPGIALPQVAPATDPLKAVPALRWGRDALKALCGALTEATQSVMAGGGALGAEIAAGYRDIVAAYDEASR